MAIGVQSFCRDIDPDRKQLWKTVACAASCDTRRAMLSYQHIYHAGNLADVHKHGLLAWMLAYLTVKDKPLTYIETHAGRALYHLDAPEARKTGEAEAGIARAERWFDETHPYRQALTWVRQAHGPDAYPGSPLLAAHLLRPDDRQHLAELHPAEHRALASFMVPYPVTCHLRDGFDLAHALVPPTPRRGLLLIDPSYEIKTDYTDIPGHIARITRAWNVGIVALWYPILTNRAHEPMLTALTGAHPQALRHEVRFAPARPGHGMTGSGMFVIHPPFGLETESARLGAHFAALDGGSPL